MTTVEEAQALLGQLGFDRERQNVRSAHTLLALLQLGPRDSWADATNPLLGTRAIMDWIRDRFGVDYKPNTRETIRRQTLHQFVAAGLLEENPDDPSRPVNSPRWCYRVHPRALRVIQTFGTSAVEERLRSYLADLPGLKAAYAAEREMERIPISLPNGEPLTLSPGGQNILIKTMVDDFCSYYTPGGIVLYVGDADAKWAYADLAALASLGVHVDSHGKMPDLVVHMPDKNWLVLLEAASSHGPVDAKRRVELANLFSGCAAGLVYVSCFPSRAEMRKYLANIAWESEVWCADSPTHLVHFNGERFLGPYE
jgi:hypothetical protein